MVGVMPLGAASSDTELIGDDVLCAGSTSHQSPMLFRICLAQSVYSLPLVSKRSSDHLFAIVLLTTHSQSFV